MEEIEIAEAELRIMIKLYKEYGEEIEKRKIKLAKLKGKGG